ncbi:MULTISPECIES: ATP-binding protein [Streptomycetaceae]|uniref:Regulatory protein n=1 Tax=Streptantibioticus cattleyicolor (strain ATCC 35852 / DSM 46488 / JCM 4925 / NBRC 14057 / NRRL 8057) TaxID=1003195 RepID=F8JPN7_STREN|nr:MULTISPECIES: ATP-binding protein [Streptomycetaceae]AEW92729.1 regulatory protein [Streptantibioticus cattleyicolor NRRL 8057 = DSM 46488]MYS57495.1 ATP-binding protein [Streptomyces sp. SID5468]CCB73083.1 Regulatory protein [Streptantibioticus cattleyicolor NRRL 8057 = DSM 46488]
MADHQEASVTLPSEPASVSVARGYVTGVLADWGLPKDAPAADAVRLIVSELATNAIRHTGGRSPDFTVGLRLDEHEWLRLGITDGHPRRPRRLPPAPDRDNGRGLLIVAHLAAEAGGCVTVEPTAEGGKTVWIALPWRTAAAGPEPAGEAGAR